VIGVMTWLVTLLVVALLLTFAAALIGINRLPTGLRPRTPQYDRLGRMVGVSENPDYHANPGEEPLDHADEVILETGDPEL
jgi:hypothetical protein